MSDSEPNYLEEIVSYTLIALVQIGIAYGSYKLMMRYLNKKFPTPEEEGEKP